MARIDRRNRSRYWWDRQTPGLSLLCADFTAHDYPAHSHDAFVVAVTEDGGSVIKSRGTVEEALPSTLFVFNPAEPHAGWMGRSRLWRYRGLYLTHQAIDSVAAGLGIAAVPYFTRNRFTDPDLIAAFLALHKSLELGGDGLQDRESLIASFGRLFARHGSDGHRIPAAPRDAALVRRAVAAMRGRHAESLQLDDIAAAVGLTPYQLIGLFRRSTGLTPHTYLTQIRLATACRLLRHGMALAEAATAVGFYDQSALTKHFKRCYAITPLQFQRAALH
jgi:AraC-like DNA-binding protein